MARVERNIPAHTRIEEGSHPKQKDWSWLLGIAIIIGVALVGSPVRLECGRAEAHGLINCTKQTRLLWIVPLPEERVVDVRGAHLASIPGDDYCDPCYRVELETGRGNIPLKNVYTNGSSGMELVVDKVNIFAHSNIPGTLQINEPGLLSIDTLFGFVVWFFFATAVSFVWEKLKPLFQGPNRNNA